jgi:hypothetical protein
MADYNIPGTYADITAALAQIVIDGAAGARVIIDSGASYLNQVMHLASGISGIEFRNHTGADVAVTLSGTSYIECGVGWFCNSATSHKIRFSGGTGGAPLIRAFNKMAGTWADCAFSRPSGGIVIKVDGTSASAALNLLRVEAYAQSGSLVTPCVEVYGNGRYAAMTADDCWFENGGYGVYSHTGNARTGDVIVRRSVFKNLNKGIYFLGKQSGGLDARFNIMYSTGALGKYGFEYSLTAGYVPTVTYYRNTHDVTTKAIKYTAGPSNVNCVVKGNWGDDVETILGSDWDYNGYRLITGAAGANDVVTAADPGFTNMAGNDYSLAAGSSLIDVGFDTGDGTDFAGNATPTGAGADIGAYEYIPVDGGLASLVVEDAETILVTFVDNGTGTEPAEASALDDTKWSAVGDYALAASASVKVGTWQYRITLSRPTVLAEAITIDTTAIATVGGGVCDDPASLPCVGVQHPDGAPWYGEALNATSLRMHFSESPWYSYPSDGALDPSVWDVSRVSDSAPVEVSAVRKIDDRTFVLTLDPTEETKYECDTSTVPTVHGGTC